MIFSQNSTQLPVVLFFTDKDKNLNKNHLELSGCNSRWGVNGIDQHLKQGFKSKNGLYLIVLFISTVV